MKLKKLLSFVAACAMAVTALTGTITSSAFDDADWDAEDGILYDYFGTETDLVLPTEVNGDKLTQVDSSFFKGSNYTSVVIPDGYTIVGAIMGLSTMQSVTLPSTLKKLATWAFLNDTALKKVNVPENIISIPSATFQGCIDPDLVIDIQTTSLTSVGDDAFKDVVGTIKVYTQAMYDLIKPLATTATVVLEGAALDLSALNEALSNASNCPESAYTADSYKVLSDAVAAGNAVSSNADATQPDIDNATKAINDAIAGLTFIGFTELDALIAQAEEILAHAEDYWAGTIQSLKNALPEIKEYKTSIGETPITVEIQTEINSKASNLEKYIADAVKVDKDALMAELQEAITEAEKINPNDYSPESYEVLSKAIEAAKEVTLESEPSAFTRAKEVIKEATNNLSLKRNDPIVNVEKGGKEAKIPTITADESMAGATSVKVVFNCAEDVAFNKYSSIEIKAVVSGKENYQKITGNNDTTGAVCQVVLPLSEAVKAGDKIDISAFTYSWNNASNHVFELSKVAFLNDKNESVKEVTKATIEEEKLNKAKEDLASAIENAKAIDTSKYTDETVAELTKAIESAKALTDEATAAEIKAAATEIEDAVKALVYKSADYTKVDEAIAKVPTDLSKYTDASVKALKDAVAAVVRDKNITEQATVDGYAKAINDAINALTVKSTPTKPEPTNPTTNTPTNPTTKATRSKEAVKKDKSAAKKAMKQAKITKLTVKSKSKKKINVTWKKVKKAKGYQVQVSTNKKFKKSKIILTKNLKKTKLNIKNKKIKSKKTYYVRVRAYATYKDTNNKTVKVYSKWNKKLRKVKVK